MRLFKITLMLVVLALATSAWAGGVSKVPVVQISKELAVREAKLKLGEKAKPVDYSLLEDIEGNPLLHALVFYVPGKGLGTVYSGAVSWIPPQLLMHEGRPITDTGIEAMKVKYEQEGNPITNIKEKYFQPPMFFYVKAEHADGSERIYSLTKQEEVDLQEFTLAMQEGAKNSKEAGMLSEWEVLINEEGVTTKDAPPPDPLEVSTVGWPIIDPDFSPGHEKWVQGPHYPDFDNPTDYHCAPTAVANILAYHDVNGWPNLINGQFPDFSPNPLIRTLDEMMEMENENVYPVIESYSQGKGYNFNVEQYGWIHCTYFDQYWDVIKDEIINNRPVYLRIEGMGHLFGHFGGHSFNAYSTGWHESSFGIVRKYLGIVDNYPDTPMPIWLRVDYEGNRFFDYSWTGCSIYPGN